MVQIMGLLFAVRPLRSIQPYPKATLRMGEDTRLCERVNTGVNEMKL